MAHLTKCLPSQPRLALGTAATRSDDLIGHTAGNYLAFAVEARGRSPQYEELALPVAGDKQVLEFLACLPTPKRQPNLLFAAVEHGYHYRRPRVRKVR